MKKLIAAVFALSFALPAQADAMRDYCGYHRCVYWPITGLTLLVVGPIMLPALVVAHYDTKLARRAVERAAVKEQSEDDDD